MEGGRVVRRKGVWFEWLVVTSLKPPTEAETLLAASQIVFFVFPLRKKAITNANKSADDSFAIDSVQSTKTRALRLSDC